MVPRRKFKIMFGQSRTPCHLEYQHTKRHHRTTSNKKKIPKIWVRAKNDRFTDILLRRILISYSVNILDFKFEDERYDS